MRNEFPKSVRRAALLRARGICEAMGTVYGLTAATRCHAPLAKGVEFDHYPIRASDGGPATLENCVAGCDGSGRAGSLVQFSGKNSRSPIVTGTSFEAKVSDTRVWQLAFLPSTEAYCGATPTGALPFLGNDVS